jgi:SET domain-containing protein
MIAVRKTGNKGRGVYAKKRFRPGDLIERCPVILLRHQERERIEPTILSMYCFRWGADSEEVAIVLGYGSLYNHSYQPNADFHRRADEGAMDFVALADILPGDEITINYNGCPDDQSPLWFHEGGWGWYAAPTACAPRAA